MLDKILSKENLNQAYLKVKRNKGAAGVDEMTIKELKLHLVKHSEEIVKQIRTRTYTPQSVKYSLTTLSDRNLSYFII